MTYLEMLKAKAGEVVTALRKQFAPARDRRALQSAIDNLAYDIQKLDEEVTLDFADNIGKFAEVAPRATQKAFEMHKMEFAITYMKGKYKEFYGKEYNPSTDDPIVQELADLEAKEE